MLIRGNKSRFATAIPISLATIAIQWFSNRKAKEAIKGVAKLTHRDDLDFLAFSNNQIEGGFPNWLAKMDVGSIILSDNKLTEKLRPQLFESSSLSVLALSINNFSGELPENIGNARAIMMLMLSGNNFSGHIPVSISNIYRLLLLDLSRNRLLGPVFADNPLLAYIDLSYNEFSGEIPVTFSTET
ncbi:putative non-specific serine/threonine protein kinase [Helianthus annuus]|nr:putative non-specific serine/threonine protein kinase [Helianthus annuus]